MHVVTNANKKRIAKPSEREAVSRAAKWACVLTKQSGNSDRSRKASFQIPSKNPERTLLKWASGNRPSGRRMFGTVILGGLEWPSSNGPISIMKPNTFHPIIIQCFLSLYLSPLNYIYFRISIQLIEDIN